MGTHNTDWFTPYRHPYSQDVRRRQALKTSADNPDRFFLVPQVYAVPAAVLGEHPPAS
jgi:hypothetical protein